MPGKQIEIWDLWYPKAASTGLPFARCRIDATSILLVHAAPPYLSAAVRNEAGDTVAEGIDLPATDDTPIARLSLHGKQITREDIWPVEQDIGQIVILPGGEAGILKEWWNSTDHSEWRWLIELYNHR